MPVGHQKRLRKDDYIVAGGGTYDNKNTLSVTATRHRENTEIASIIIIIIIIV